MNDNAGMEFVCMLLFGGLKARGVQVLLNRVTDRTLSHSPLKLKPHENHSWLFVIYKYDTVISKTIYDVVSYVHFDFIVYIFVFEVLSYRSHLLEWFILHSRAVLLGHL